MDLYNRFNAIRPLQHRFIVDMSVLSIENGLQFSDLEDLSLLKPFYRYLVGSQEEIQRHDYRKFSKFLYYLDNNTINDKYKKFTNITIIPEDIQYYLETLIRISKEEVNRSLKVVERASKDLFYIIVGNLDRTEAQILNDLLLSVTRDIKDKYPNEYQPYIDKFIEELSYPTPSFSYIYHNRLEPGNIKFTGEFRRIIYDTLERYIQAIEDLQTGRTIKTPLRVSPSISRTQ